MFSTYCESHSGDIAFRVVTRLLRAITGVNDLDTTAAATASAPSSPMPTPRMCCCSMTCSGSPTPPYRYPRSRPTLVGAA